MLKRLWVVHALTTHMWHSIVCPMLKTQSSVMTQFLSFSSLLRSGTLWPQRQKTWSTRCWPLIQLKESLPQTHSNTPGSVYVSHIPPFHSLLNALSEENTKCLWHMSSSCVYSNAPLWRLWCTDRRLLSAWRNSMLEGNSRWVTSGATIQDKIFLRRLVVQVLQSV